MNTELNQWIVEASIPDMQAAMETGKVSAEKLVQAYLDKIREWNPTVNAVLEVNPEALHIARALDKERRAKGSRGALHGIPILLKDNIDTHDRMHTSAGSLALEQSIAPQDSFVAAQLRNAGAILLGKTNMTEWANFMSDSMPAGYSSRGGRVLNPYGPGELFVGGSSSGSGVAVAASLCAAAIGTETTGSIISPSNQNGIVGIKPTVGLISRSGIIPITFSQDTAGPMAKTVTDAAIVLGALTAADEQDEATLGKRTALRDYTPFLDKSFLQQATIGIPRFYYKDLDEERLAIAEAAIEVLKASGATIIDPVHLPCESIDWKWDVLHYEFKAAMNRYLSKLPPHAPIHSLQQLIAFNEKHADRALKYGQDVLIQAERTSGTLTEQPYLDSVQQNTEWARKQGIDFALGEHRLDALMFLGNEDLGDIAARAGYPVITVPGGYAQQAVVHEEGLTTKGPQGISFAGAAYSEPVLIKIAYGYEQATKHRIPPNIPGSPCVDKK